MADLLTLRAGGTEIRLECGDGFPAPDTAALGMANLLFVARGKRVLDLAGGTGFFGISAAKAGAKQVWLGDPDGGAVELARRNAERNEVDVHCKKGEAFDAFEGRKFDLIIADPPQIPAPPGVEGPPFGGEEGLDGFRPILSGAGRHLERGGELLTRLISLAATKRFEKLLGMIFRFRHFPKVRQEFTPDGMNALHDGLFDHLKRLKDDKRAEFEEEDGRLFYRVRYYMAMIK